MKTAELDYYCGLDNIMPQIGRKRHEHLRKRTIMQAKISCLEVAYLAFGLELHFSYSRDTQREHHISAIVHLVEQANVSIS